MQKIVTHLWYPEKAEEAAAFYASLIPNSSVDSVTDLPVDSPSGPAGSVQVVDFTLGGVKFQAISTSEIKISVLIDAAYAELAVRALHSAYGLEVV